MLNLAHRVLQYLGATEVINVSENVDPTTEEEFLVLKHNSPTPITWEMYQKAYSIVEQSIGTKLLRVERDRLLAKTDWIMTADNYASLANKEEWVAYRQALRDLPTNPPAFKWKDMTLDIESMDLPIQPPVTRVSNSTS
jgi:hypothetical protein